MSLDKPDLKIGSRLVINLNHSYIKVDDVKYSIEVINSAAIDRDGDVVLPQTFLKFKKRCELNFNAELNNLDYYVTLKPKDHTKNFPEGYDYADWGDDFDMCFVGFSYQLRERLDNNLRKIKLGN